MPKDNNITNSRKKTESLQIYRATWDFITYTLPKLPSMKREYKFSLGDVMKKDILNMPYIIYDINDQLDGIGKITELNRFIRICRRIKISLNMCFELKLFHHKPLSLMSNKLKDINEQANKWRTYNENYQKRIDAEQRKQ